MAAKSVASLEGVSGSRLAPRVQELSNPNPNPTPTPSPNQVQELCALHCEKEPNAPKHWAVRAYPHPYPQP